MRPEIRDAANKELFDEWLEVIAERTGTDPERDMYPRLVGRRRPAVGDAATELYVRADPPVADHHADPRAASPRWPPVCPNPPGPTRRKQ